MVEYNIITKVFVLSSFTLILSDYLPSMVRSAYLFNLKFLQGFKMITLKLYEYKPFNCGKCLAIYVTGVYCLFDPSFLPLIFLPSLLTNAIKTYLI